MSQCTNHKVDTKLDPTLALCEDIAKAINKILQETLGDRKSPRRLYGPTDVINGQLVTATQALATSCVLPLTTEHVSILASQVASYLLANVSRDQCLHLGGTILPQIINNKLLLWVEFATTDYAL